MMSGNFKTATQSLRQSRWRTIFTMLGIIIGIVSVVTLVSLGEGIKGRISGQINQLGNDVITVRPGKLLTQNGHSSGLNLYSLLSPSTLTSKDIESLRGLPQVASVTPIEYIANSATSDNAEMDNIFVAATTPNFADTLRQNVQYGAFFTDNSLNLNTAVIGSDVAAQLFNILNPVGSSLTILGQTFTVQGVLAPTTGGLAALGEANYNSSVLIPVSAADSLTNNHESILEILARVKPGTNLDAAAAAINSALAKNHGGSGDFTVLKQSQLLSVSSQVINTFTGFIAAVAAISLIVGGIGIMNIMLVSVSERTREIGIRKAIGATNRQIRRQFLIEGLVLTVSAGLIGIIASLIIISILRVYSSWHPAYSIWIMILAAIVAIAFGLIFSLIPALKAARKNPIEALRGE